jgi:hypothetical protein
VNGGSRRNYDDDKYYNQRDIKREGQPRTRTDALRDGREIILRERERRAQLQERKRNRGEGLDTDMRRSEKNLRQDQGQEQKKKKYDTPYESRWCSICYDDGQEDSGDARLTTRSIAADARWLHTSPHDHQAITDTDTRTAKETHARSTRLTTASNGRRQSLHIRHAVQQDFDIEGTARGNRSGNGRRIGRRHQCDHAADP